MRARRLLRRLQCRLLALHHRAHRRLCRLLRVLLSLERLALHFEALAHLLSRQFDAHARLYGPRRIGRLLISSHLKRRELRQLLSLLPAAQRALERARCPLLPDALGPLVELREQRATVLQPLLARREAGARRAERSAQRVEQVGASVGQSTRQPREGHRAARLAGARVAARTAAAHALALALELAAEEDIGFEAEGGRLGAGRSEAVRVQEVLAGRQRRGHVEHCPSVRARWHRVGDQARRGAVVGGARAEQERDSHLAGRRGTRRELLLEEERDPNWERHTEHEGGNR